jgi:hypothetical protein
MHQSHHEKNVLTPFHRTGHHDKQRALFRDRRDQLEEPVIAMQIQMYQGEGGNQEHVLFGLIPINCAKYWDALQ